VTSIRCQWNVRLPSVLTGWTSLGEDEPKRLKPEECPTCSEQVKEREYAGVGGTNANR
jgi:hypothetical protein